MSFDAFTAVGLLAQAGAQIGTGFAARSAAKDQAKEARRAGRDAAEDERRKGRRLQGKQRAAFAKSGVKIDEGTPLDVLAQTEADAEISALRAKFFFEQQEDAFKSAGKVALTRGLLGAGGTILGGAEVFRDAFRAFQSRTPPTSAFASPPATSRLAPPRVGGQSPGFVF